MYCSLLSLPPPSASCLCLLLLRCGAMHAVSCLHRERKTVGTDVVEPLPAAEGKSAKITEIFKSENFESGAVQKFVYLEKSKMLQNVTWLAIVAVHTADNETPKVRKIMSKIHRNIVVDREVRPVDADAQRPDEREQREHLVLF